jgi:L-amino acid N-acyltransferase YncA
MCFILVFYLDIRRIWPMQTRQIRRELMTPELWSEILPWRNDPLTYLWTRTQRPITLEEHTSWFENRSSLMDYQPIFSYFYESSFLGLSRLDKLTEALYEVSLIVNPVERGQGYGRYILSDICHYFLSLKSKDVKLSAIVHSENLYSQLLFKSMRFVKIKSDESFDQFIFCQD